LFKTFDKEKSTWINASDAMDQLIRSKAEVDKDDEMQNESVVPIAHVDMSM